MHYLDNAATTPVLEVAAQTAMEMMLHQFGNPSSVHKLGQAAARVLEESRKVVADALGALPAEVTFTSCGTESIGTAVHAAAHLHRHRKGHAITTTIEHAAVRNSFAWLQTQGFDVTYLAPDSTGHIRVDDLRAALQGDTVLVSFQLVNNEVGTVQDVAQLCDAVKAHNASTLIHIDAVQGLLKVPLLPHKWGCDFMSVSGHKIGAPKGIGALYHKKGLRMPPLLVGGGQEKGLRAGTEALPNIAAFAAALTAQMPEQDTMRQQVEALAAYLKERLAAELPDAVYNTQSDVPHIQNISVPGCKSEVMLRVLESEEVYVSSGSACAKGKQSEVLKALGLPKKQSDSALRISISAYNTKEDIDALIGAMKKGAAMLRR